MCTTKTNSELFSIPENKLIGYADDSTFMALISDLGRISKCCDLWRMKFNASKT